MISAKVPGGPHSVCLDTTCKLAVSTKWRRIPCRLLVREMSGQSTTHTIDDGRVGRVWSFLTGRIEKKITGSLQ